MPPFPNMWKVCLALWPTDQNINRDHLFIKDYVPTKFEASWANRSGVSKDVGDWHDLWPWPLTYWPEYQLGSSTTHQELSTYQVWRLYDKALLSYQLHKAGETDMTFDLDFWPIELDFWPIDLNINKDDLLIKNCMYLPTKFETCRTKQCWVNICTRYGRSTWPLTYWPEYQ